MDIGFIYFDFVSETTAGDPGIIPYTGVNQRETFYLFYVRLTIFRFWQSEGFFNFIFN